MTLWLPVTKQPVCVAYVPGGPRVVKWEDDVERYVNVIGCHRCGNGRELHLLERVETYSPAGPYLLSSTVVPVLVMPT